MKKYHWLFYQVKDNQNSISIIFSTTVTYVNFTLAALGFAGCIKNNTILSIFMFIILFISMIAKNVVYSKIKIQIMKWEKVTKVKTIGSKFSYSDPFQVIAYKLK